MPAYEYRCPACGVFDAVRPIAQRNDACACPECGAAARRVIASAPAIAAMAMGARLAHAANERSAHAPMSVGEYRALRHPPGCGCCGTRKSGATLRGPDGAKAVAGKRPWMISH